MIALEISRQVGILINRRGIIEYVVIGDRNRIEIPKLATERVGRARFRGLRFIHTHLNNELLTKEDLTDLALLQLDLIACLTDIKGSVPGSIHIAYLIPANKKQKAWDFIGPIDINSLNLDFIEFITELENEFVRERGRLHQLDDQKEKAVLICVVSPGSKKIPEDNLAELRDLCYSAGISVLDTVIQRPKELHPTYLIGKGKMEEVIMKCQQLGADLIVFDEGLTPGQINNISSITELNVIDRNQLILDIFAQRAKTNEAKIQVELAQLRYILPRLASINTAFSRITGRIGTRGPGETKLEVDKRRIREKITFLEGRLRDIEGIRDRKRERRKASGIPVVSIVGYTNSGKSTLLNLLTKSKVEVQDMAFSTLNPTTRTIKYPERKNIILTDTVGFIKNLPQVLLKAFIATLEELKDAHLLLHLVDISTPDFEEKIQAVDEILKLLNLYDKERLIVFNKIDNMNREFVKNIENRYNAISISCLKKEGIDRLVETIVERLKN
ncbi:MAG TPA: GTPase HflX [Syntrophorhabdaceae bacterium]|nr:GTPase HflX [Syntrophorhabdaceae bacterium]